MEEQKRLQEIEKCSSPIGDGNESLQINKLGQAIEKCSSPIGDGNGPPIFLINF